MRALQPQRKVPSRSAGFTLIELAIVVLVIAVVAGLAAPAISQAMNERRASEATLDVVRLGRHARSAAAAYGRAHLLRFVDQNLGRIEAYRGRNNRCNQDWGAIAGGGCANNPDCVDSLDMEGARFRTSSFDIQLAAADFGSVDICYEPSGVMRWRAGTAGPFLGTNRIGGGMRFTLTPRVGGTPQGVVRRVVLPLGGDARVVR
ncbi:MAG: prepilin-type N-terminal cleavage/methylation domain-containing protein [Myxococcota bacterium]